jgi:mRNA interferase YafQ
MYTPKPTVRYAKDVKRVKSSGFDMRELDEVLERLAAGEPLDERYRDHQLKGKRKKYRECHIRPDWILVYQRDKDARILILIGTGTHSDQFG